MFATNNQKPRLGNCVLHFVISSSTVSCALWWAMFSNASHDRMRPYEIAMAISVLLYFFQIAFATKPKQCFRSYWLAIFAIMHLMNLRSNAYRILEPYNVLYSLSVLTIGYVICLWICTRRESVLRSFAELMFCLLYAYCGLAIVARELL